VTDLRQSAYHASDYRPLDLFDIVTTQVLSATPEYVAWLADLKSRVERARQRAALSVNRELISLYWQIGCEILERQQRQEWGAKVADQLAADLHSAFPDMRGFSSRNLKYMRALAGAMAERRICATACCTITLVSCGDTARQVKKHAKRASGMRSNRLSTADRTTY
jgi:DUF1016 N-terminal domain